MGDFREITIATLIERGKWSDLIKSYKIINRIYNNARYVSVLLLELEIYCRDKHQKLGKKTRPYNNEEKKKTCKFVDFAVPADHRIKLEESEKRDKYLDLARELKKSWDMNVTIIQIVIRAFGTVTKGLLKGLEDLETSGDHSNYCITENGQNTGDLGRLALTQTPVKDHLLKLIPKTLKD